MRINNIKFSSQRGFTLLEILVVVSIIGIISSLIMANLSTARRKAQDSRTVQEMHQIAVAMEIYAADHNGLYPNLGNAISCIGSTNCMLANVTPGVQVGSLAIVNITTPLILGTNNYNSRGFIYNSASCNPSSPNCKGGEAVIIAPTYSGLVCQTVGVWEPVHTCAPQSLQLQAQ